MFLMLLVYLFFLRQKILDSMKLQIKRDKIIVLMESKQKEVQEKIQKLHNTPYSNSIGSLSSPLEILPGISFFFLFIASY